MSPQNIHTIYKILSKAVTFLRIYGNIKAFLSGHRSISSAWRQKCRENTQRTQFPSTKHRNSARIVKSNCNIHI